MQKRKLTKKKPSIIPTATSFILATGDLQLGERTIENYRWNIFTDLVSVAVSQEKDGAQCCLGFVLLGDITEAKDNHSSKLVNRLARELAKLAEIAPVYILKGNHDYYINPSEPFFEFVNYMHNVYWVNEPTEITVGDFDAIFVPHSRTPLEDWKELDADEADIIFAHQTFTGAQAERGQILDGVPRDYFGEKVVIAGDVHVPQSVGNVIYTGAPHPVDIGDDYEPRLLKLYLEGGIVQTESFPLKSIQRAKIVILEVDDLDDLGFQEGDQIKVIARLSRTKLDEWPEMKQEIKDWAKDKGVKLLACSMEYRQADSTPTEKAETDKPSDMFVSFCNAKKLGKRVRKAGQAILARV